MIAWTKIKYAAALVVLGIFVAGTATIAAQKVVQSKRIEAAEAQRSTPIGAMRYLLEAFDAFDGQRIIDSHVTNAPAIHRMVVSMAAAVTAEGRLRNELQARFQSTGGMGRGPGVQMGFKQAHLDNAEEIITGEKATVNIPGRETHHLVRVGKVWKLTDPDGGVALTNAEPMAMHLDNAARIYNETAAAIAQGRFQSAPEANKALRHRLLTELSRR